MRSDFFWTGRTVTDINGAISVSWLKFLIRLHREVENSWFEYAYCSAPELIGFSGIRVERVSVCVNVGGHISALGRAMLPK